MRADRLRNVSRMVVAVGVVAVGSLAGGGAGQASGPGAVCNVPSRYATIQAAVDAPACTTIRVAPGAYAGNVTIARKLLLYGARVGQDARTRHGGGESVVSASITVAASNVVIDGFTVNGPPGGGTAAFVLQAGNSGETVQNNVIINAGRAASIQTGRTTFRTNLVRNTSTATDGFQANSTPVQNLAFLSNSFSGADPNIYNADVTVIEGDANVTVAGNSSSGDGTLVALFKTAGARIYGNSIVGGGGSSALYIGGANRDVLISGNVISNAGSAVKVADSFHVGTNAGVTVTGNFLRSNQYGVNVVATSVSSAVQVSRNSLTGNAVFGVFSDPAAGAATNAACNWWGSMRGPGPAGPGTGDKVSTNASYRPWLKSANLSGGCR
jgi:hypothetical protein